MDFKMLLKGLGVGLVILLLSDYLSAKRALAAPPPAAAPAAKAIAPGLWTELSTTADGVTVRRVRDNGEGVVCYVASFASPYTTGAGISCVREYKPYP